MAPHSKTDLQLRATLRFRERSLEAGLSDPLPRFPTSDRAGLFAEQQNGDSVWIWDLRRPLQPVVLLHHAAAAPGRDPWCGLARCAHGSGTATWALSQFVAAPGA